MAPSGCVHHEAVQRQHDANVLEHGEIWRAIDSLRTDIKNLIGKIGMIVGGSVVLNSIVMMVMQYLMDRHK